MVDALLLGGASEEGLDILAGGEAEATLTVLNGFGVICEACEKDFVACGFVWLGVGERAGFRAGGGDVDAVAEVR